MRNVSALRLVMWASVGFLVSFGWGLYFASTDKALPIGPLVYNLASMTQPLVAGVLYSGLASHLALAWVAVANAATYALLGLIVETIRKRQHAERGCYDGS